MTQSKIRKQLVEIKQDSSVIVHTVLTEAALKRITEATDGKIIEVDDISKLTDDPSKFYLDGETLKVDTDYSVKLMPISNIRRNYKNRLKVKLQTAATAEEFDAETLIQLQAELIRVPHLTDKQLYEQALNNLKEDKLSKPAIKKLLQNKIASYEEK